MQSPSHPIVLASGSPRRREILQQMHLTFQIDTSDIDEHYIGGPVETVTHLCQSKAKAVADRHPCSLIVAADTIVTIDNHILGKPKDHEDANLMLHKLAGRWHSVFTGVCVRNTETGKEFTHVEETKVHFLPINTDDLNRYLATDEPYDKAGGYAIQGIAGEFIDSIQGSYTNVVGFPMHIVARLLLEAD